MNTLADGVATLSVSRRVRVLPAAGLLFAASSAFAVSAPRPDAVATAIARRGAAATLADLNRTAQLDAVLDGIASGQAAWVAVAPKLAVGADGAAAEGLGVALADALPKAPRAVLKALDPANGHVTGAERVCGLPFIERPASMLRAYRRRALRAVAAVRDPALNGIRADCLAALERGR